MHDDADGFFLVIHKNPSELEDIAAHQHIGVDKHREALVVAKKRDEKTRIAEIRQPAPVANLFNLRIDEGRYFV